MPGRTAYYPYRDLPVLRSPITPLYMIINSGAKLKGHNPEELVDQYLTSVEDCSPTLPSDIHHIEERIKLTNSIWDLIHSARNGAVAWGRSNTAKGKRKRDEQDDDEKGSSADPTTRSKSSIRSNESLTVAQCQDEGKGKGKQKAGDSQGTKHKMEEMDEVSLTGQALERLVKRQRTQLCDDWKTSISDWAETIGG